MTPPVAVRLGAADDLPAVAELYREWGYRAAARPEDTLIVAEDNGALVGVVRLAREHGHVVLRGMRIQPAYQRSGLGTRMLELLVQHLQGNCYCLPYSHLLGFYARVGFREITPEGAPSFLAERLATYRSEGLQVAIMHRPA